MTADDLISMVHVKVWNIFDGKRTVGSGEMGRREDLNGFDKDQIFNDGCKRNN